MEKQIIYGQYFTPAKIVELMLLLRRNSGRVLEPSCGDGAFLRCLEPEAVAIELDTDQPPDPRIKFMDFFDYPVEEKFDTVIGNPPYVRFKDIRPETREILPMGLFDKRSSLYLFFIAKAIAHLNPGGEMIFITPREFLKSTGAKELNTLLYEAGSFTHWYDMGDARLFADAAPTCAVWRWVKGRTERGMESGGEFQCRDGQIWFGAAASGKVGDWLDIKVGALSGANDVFESAEHGNVDMAYSETHATGKTKRMIYNICPPYLEQFKEVLLARGVKEFNDGNWWEWGRKYPEDLDMERIYVNVRTRQDTPFFVSDIKAYDGSLLGLFPRKPMDLHKAADILNNTDWDSLGFVADGRKTFTQRSLYNAPVDLEAVCD